MYIRRQHCCAVQCRESLLNILRVAQRYKYKDMTQSAKIGKKNKKYKSSKIGGDHLEHFDWLRVVQINQ